MKALITHFKTDSITGDAVYENGKPAIFSKIVDFPLTFTLMDTIRSGDNNTDIFIRDIISIDITTG